MRNGNWPLHALRRKDLGGLKHNLQEKQETFKQALIKHKAHKELIIKTQFMKVKILKQTNEGPDLKTNK